MNCSIRNIIKIFFVTSLLQSCVYPFLPDIESEDIRILVVEGMITDEEGPFRVKLTNSFELDNMELFGEPVLGADVQIFDDHGNVYTLSYKSLGWYQTEDTLLKAVPGNIYIH